MYSSQSPIGRVNLSEHSTSRMVWKLTPRRNPLLIGSTFRRAVCSAPSKLHFPPFSSPNRPSPRPLAGHSQKLAKKARFLTFQRHSATSETPLFLAFSAFFSLFLHFRGACKFAGPAALCSGTIPKRTIGLFKELTQVTVTLDLPVRKTLRKSYLAIFCEPPVPKR